MINTEKDLTNKKNLTNTLFYALIAFVNGEESGRKGMKNHEQNILMVPEPHEEYYDDGCNWVIFPIMSRDQMLKWKGEAYDLAFFAGERRLPTGVSATRSICWSDEISKKTAEEAEEQFTSGLAKFCIDCDGLPDFKVCGTEDLRSVGKTMGEIGLALADLHTRESKGSTFTYPVRDLGEAIKNRVISKGNEVYHNDVVNGIDCLAKRLNKDGMRTPGLPDVNYIGTDGKHVLKIRADRSAPDPILVAVKGANNFYRQWGMRLMTGCGTDGDASYSSTSVCSSREKIPTAPEKRIVGGFVVVTPDRDSSVERSISDVSDFSSLDS